MKKRTNSILFITFIMILFAFSCSSEPGLQIFAVARNEGHLDGCGCPSAPAGGVARRVAAIEQRVSNLNSPGVLNFDTGGFSNFFTEEGTIQTKALAEIFDNIGMTAVNISNRELSGNLDLFLDITQKASTPFISTNIFDQNSNSPFFEPFIIKEIAGKRVAVLGITAPTQNSWSIEGKTLTIIEPETALRQVILQIKPKADFVILLAHIPKRKIAELLEKLPHIDLVLGADGFTLNREILTINNTAVCYPGKQAQFMCHLNYSLGSNSFEFKSMEMIRLTGEMAEDMEIRRIVDAALDQVERLKTGRKAD